MSSYVQGQPGPPRTVHWREVGRPGETQGCSLHRPIVREGFLEPVGPFPAPPPGNDRREEKGGPGTWNCGVFSLRAVGSRHEDLERYILGLVYCYCF